MKTFIDSPPAEQEICKICGLCCDGTLFQRAVLDPGEKEKLPGEIREVYVIVDCKERFNLPCPAFKGKCTIYNSKRANVCSRYRCQLLIDFSNQARDFHSAKEIIREATRLRTELLLEYKELKKIPQLITMNIAQLINEQNQKGDTSDIDEYGDSLFQARLKIFDLLMEKYFRSKSRFDEMTSNS